MNSATKYRNQIGRAASKSPGSDPGEPINLTHYINMAQSYNQHKVVEQLLSEEE